MCKLQYTFNRIKTENKTKFKGLSHSKVVADMDSIYLTIHSEKFSLIFYLRVLFVISGKASPCQYKQTHFFLGYETKQICSYSVVRGRCLSS